MINCLSLSAITFDLIGTLYLYPKDMNIKKTNLRDTSRRSTRTATLDGISSLYDTGYTASDRTLTLAIDLDKTEIIDKLQYFLKTYSKLILILDDGAYICHIQTFKRGICKILIIEELT